MKKFATLFVLVVMGLSAIAQEKKAKTINIDFKSTIDEGMTLNVTLPLQFLESFQPQIQQILTQIQAEHGMDFKQIWTSVKDSGPAEFISIKSEEADIQVSTTSSHMIVKVNEKTEGHDIEVHLPMALGDALFTLDGDIDYEGILQALETVDGDLVTISGADMNGRIWIE